jgi:hypothetical protein
MTGVTRQQGMHALLISPLVSEMKDLSNSTFSFTVSIPQFLHSYYNICSLLVQTSIRSNTVFCVSYQSLGEGVLSCKDLHPILLSILAIEYAEFNHFTVLGKMILTNYCVCLILTVGLTS